MAMKFLIKTACMECSLQIKEPGLAEDNNLSEKMIRLIVEVFILQV